MKIKTILMVIPIALTGLSFWQAPSLNDLIAPGATPEKLAGDLSFTEGPTADDKGNVFFTDQPNDRILKWDIKEGLTTFMQPAGRANGLAFDSKGILWACTEDKNELWKIYPDKKYEVIPSLLNGKKLNGPNDLWPDKKGGVYFTDPFYRRQWWDHKDMPQDIQAVYYLNPDHKTITRLTNDLKQPNGIVGTPDGKRLFVADIGANQTWVYNVNNDGSLSGKTLFCNMGSDGMTIDSKGNIYLCGRGVTVFDKNGNKLGNIEIPEKWTANVCFGDKDLKSLFITASTGLYRVKMKVKGTRG